jgi:ribonuclease HI
VGVYTGLDLAWQKGHKKVEVEVDSEVVFNALNGKGSNLAANEGIGGSGSVIHI